MTKYLFTVVVIVCLLSFFGLHSVTLFDVDEAVFAQATREMVEGHDWITPTYNGENRYDKPILFYWLMAISYRIFGVNEFAARFPSAFAGTLLILAVFFFVRHAGDERRAFYAAVSSSVSLYFFLYAHAAVTDMTLTLFITLALFSFSLSQGNDRRFLYGVYLFSALAFLTKGLIGIVFPFGIIMAYVLLTGGAGGIKKVFSPGGIILFLIISMPWYAVQIGVNGREFLEQFFIKHHFQRYTGVISGHRGAAYYYILALTAGLFPWIAFLPGGIRGAVRSLKLLRERRIPGLPYDDIHAFTFVWFCFIFLFFSFSTTKLPNYVLPLIPAASVLISSGMAAEGRWLKYPHIFIAAVALSSGAAFLSTEKYLGPLGIADMSWAYYSAAAMFSIALVAGVAIFSGREYFRYLTVLVIVFLMIISVKALPVVNRHLQGTLYRYSLLARDGLHEGGNLITFQINNPSIVFYSGHKVWRIGRKEELPPPGQNGVQDIAITKVKYIGELTGAGFRLLEEDGKYALLERR